jgi:hypothetical protein
LSSAAKAASVSPFSQSISMKPQTVRRRESRSRTARRALVCGLAVAALELNFGALAHELRVAGELRDLLIEKCQRLVRLSEPRVVSA